MIRMQTFEAKKIPVPANYGPALEREADRVGVSHGFDLFPVQAGARWTSAQTMPDNFFKVLNSGLSSFTSSAKSCA